VKRGKRELFLKDDTALAKFLLDAGIDGVVVRTSSTRQPAAAPGTSDVTLSGQPLRNLLDEVLNFRELCQRLSRFADPLVVQTAVRETGLDVDALHDTARVEDAMRRIEARLKQDDPDMALAVSVKDDAEHGCKKIEVSTRAGVASRLSTIDHALLSTLDWRKLRELQSAIAALGQPPFIVSDGADAKDTVELAGVDALWDYVDARARKGMQLQRYKGLGEMNAETLWETTMNPDTRVLLQVRIEDTMQTEEMFSILMGDQVEPRREFIESNAMNVRNLDI
jgi:DNA gyrase subunit B